MTNSIQTIPLTKIHIRPGFLARSKLDKKFVRQLMQEIRSGKHRDPILVFQADGHYLLADGRHRYEAQCRLVSAQPETQLISARVVSCSTSLTDLNRAIFFASLVRNRASLSRRERGLAVKRLIVEFGQGSRSTSFLTRLCGLTRKPIDRLRRESFRDGQIFTPNRVRCARGGSAYTMRIKSL